MNYKIEQYNSFLPKLHSLNYTVPTGVVFLPVNIDDAESSSNFIYAESVSELKKFFRLNQIDIRELSENSAGYRAQRSADWWGPIIFISFSVLSENNTLISVGLNVLSNYVTDIFKGGLGNNNAKLEIVVETRKNGPYRKITYEGGVDGIRQLPEIIESLRDDKQNG